MVVGDRIKKIKNPGLYEGIIPHYKATTFLNAFVLNALVVAVVAATSAEMRADFGDRFEDIEGTSGGKKALAYFLTLFWAWLIAFISYGFLYVLFGFGAGMITATLPDADRIVTFTSTKNNLIATFVTIGVIFATCLTLSVVYGQKTDDDKKNPTTIKN